MQRILIPTDFSIVAENALDYAIEIASTFNSKLFLCHVYHIHKVDYNLNFSEEEQPYRKRLVQQMELTKLKFENKIQQKGLSLQTIIDKDTIFSLFSEKVDQYGIDLIIMGSKGATGLEKMIFGTVAATALDSAKVPVLVVPPGYSFASFEQILLAKDQHEIAKRVLLPLQKLALAHSAKVCMLRVNDGLDENTASANTVALEGVETSYHEIPMSKSVNESINTFVKEQPTDLMVMVRREKGFFEGIFKRSITKNQVYNSEIPLLVLPDGQK